MTAMDDYQATVDTQTDLLSAALDAASGKYAAAVDGLRQKSSAEVATIGRHYGALTAHLEAERDILVRANTRQLAAATAVATAEYEAITSRARRTYDDQVMAAWGAVLAESKGWVQ